MYNIAKQEFVYIPEYKWDKMGKTEKHGFSWSHLKKENRCDVTPIVA